MAVRCRSTGRAVWCRCAASASLGLSSAMTLSAWIDPAASQSEWRTIMQRQTDAYFLNASNDRGPLRPTGGGDVWVGRTQLCGWAVVESVASWTHVALTYNGSQLVLVCERGAGCVVGGVGGDSVVVESVVDWWESAVWGVFPGVDRRCAGVQPCVVAGRDPDRHGDAAWRRVVGYDVRRRCRRMWWRRAVSPSQVNRVVVGVDGQRGGDGVSGGALSGGGLHGFAAGGHAPGLERCDTALSASTSYSYRVRRVGCGRPHEWRTRRSRARRRRRVRIVAAVGADECGGDGGELESGESVVDGVDGQRGGDEYRVSAVRCGCTTFAQLVTPTAPRSATPG